MVKTNVKKHPRKTRSGRTTVKKHKRNVSRLRSLGYSEIANLRKDNDNKPFRLTEKELRDMDDKMPQVKAGDNPDPFFNQAIKDGNLSALESIILQKLIKEYDGDLHILDTSLNYEENLELVLDDHPYRSDQKISELYHSNRFETKEELQEIHNARSSRSKAMDESRSNQATLTIDEVIAINDIDRIGADLSKIDVEQVDTVVKK